MSLFSHSFAVSFSYCCSAGCNTRSACSADKALPLPDTLVLSNGDTLHGKLVEEAGGTVTFHCDPLGDVKLTWDKIKELHAGGELRRAELGDEESRQEGG